jgi:hypothetical protein
MKNLALCLVFVSATISYSQVDVNRFTNIVQSLSSGSAAYGAGFQGRYNNTMEVIGDVYLDSAFRNTAFIMKGNAPRLETPSRYDILNREFEVKTTGGVRVLNGEMVNYFKLLRNNDSVSYVNASNYKLDGSALLGFLEILSPGKIQLLIFSKLDIIKPSYNPSLEVGDKNSYVKRKETIYYSRNSELFKMGGKKEILGLFGEEKSKVEAYVESNNLNYKKTESLKKIFDFYNSLVL